EDPFSRKSVFPSLNKKNIFKGITMETSNSKTKVFAFLGTAFVLCLGAALLLTFPVLIALMFTV
ncbi:MAG: hypothetical protein ACTTIU_07515, partial [Treponema lecithinolyticum]|uniref:hypothetical protein n=1 Tax=Treponema lecithinolyticum TaxID=53418 RepID=UPI003FA31DD0